MAKRKMLRRLAVLLVLALALPVSAAGNDSFAVERWVYDYLTEEMGLNSAAACGILANIEQESGFQLTILGDQGTSFGLCQWHEGRYVNLRTYCTTLGMDYRTVEGQMAYLKYELGNSYTSLYLTLRAIENTADGAYRAAYLWCTQFERPADMETKGMIRGNLARFKYWNRYNSIRVTAEDSGSDLTPEEAVRNIQQQEVTIPLPPVQEESQEKRYQAQLLEAVSYTPWHAPAQEGSCDSNAATGFAVGALFAVLGDGNQRKIALPEPEIAELPA